MSDWAPRGNRSGWPRDLRDAGPSGPVVTMRIEDLPPEERARIEALAPATAQDHRRAWALQIQAAQHGDEAAQRRLDHDHPRADRPTGGDDDVARGKPLVNDVEAFEQDLRAGELRLEDIAERWEIEIPQVKAYCHNHDIPLPLWRGEDPEQRRRRDAARKPKGVSREKPEAAAAPVAPGEPSAAADPEGHNMPEKRQPEPTAAASGNNMPDQPGTVAVPQPRAPLKDDQVRDGLQALTEPRPAAPEREPVAAEPMAAAVAETSADRIRSVRERLAAKLGGVNDRIAAIHSGMEELPQLVECAAQLAQDIEAIDRAAELLAVAV